MSESLNNTQLEAYKQMSDVMQTAIENHASSMEQSYVNAAIEGNEQSHPLHVEDTLRNRQSLIADRVAVVDAGEEIARLQAKLDSGLLRSSEVDAINAEIDEWKSTQDSYKTRDQENTDVFRDLLNAEAHSQTDEDLNSRTEEFWGGVNSDADVVGTSSNSVDTEDDPVKLITREDIENELQASIERAKKAEQEDNQEEYEAAIRDIQSLMQALDQNSTPGNEGNQKSTLFDQDLEPEEEQINSTEAPASNLHPAVINSVPTRKKGRLKSLRDRIGLIIRGDVNNGTARDRKSEDSEKNQRRGLRRVVGAAAVIAAGAAVYWAGSKVGIDINPLDGDGLDLNPFNNGDQVVDGVNLDVDGDGDISREEFSIIDANGDGTVSQQELLDVLSSDQKQVFESLDNQAQEQFVEIFGNYDKQKQFGEYLQFTERFKVANPVLGGVSLAENPLEYDKIMHEMWLNFWEAKRLADENSVAGSI